MANRIFRKTQHLEREVKIVGGSIQLDGSGAVDSSSGMGFSASKTGTGEYKVALEDPYSSLLTYSANLTAVSGIDMTVQMKEEDVDATSPYVTFNTLTSGSPANYSGAETPVLHFTLHLKNTNV